MKHHIQLVILILTLLLVTGCIPGRRSRQQPPPSAQPEATTIAPTDTVVLPEPAQPTPTNTRVVSAVSTPEPTAPPPLPTDTPSPLPTDTPLPLLTDTPPPLPTNTPLPLPTDTPAASTSEDESNGSTIAWTDADGKPDIASGQDRGYLIWTDNNRVHIRVTTLGRTRVFSGRIVGNGTILEVKRVGHEKMDVTLRQDLNQMDFSWVSTGGVDGLDFTFSGTDLRFQHLRIDNKSAPTFVIVGVNQLSLDNGLPLHLVR